MKKLFGLASLASVIAAAAFAPTEANAQQFYVEGAYGLVTNDKLDWNGWSYKMDDGDSWSLAAGVRLWSKVDVELEYSYNEMEYSCCTPNNTNETRLMANATYNFRLGPVEPYAGAGLGFSWVTYESVGSYKSEADAEFAYQLIGGVRVPIGERWGVFGEYRYQALFDDAKGEPTMGTVDVWEHEGHNFLFGVRFNIN